MIETGIYNIEHPKGTTFDKTFTITIGGTAMNLTGYSAEMQVRETFEDATIVLSLASGSGITLGGSAGTIRVKVTPSMTSSTTIGHYQYDLLLTSPSGDVDRILMGQYELAGVITQ